MATAINISLTVKRGDVGLIFSDTLTDENGPIPLANATVKFIMRKGGASSPKVEATATIVDEDDATVTYTSDTDDMDTVAKYKQEWEITYNSGQILTVPSNAYNEIIVMQDLNPT